MASNRQRSRAEAESFARVLSPLLTPAYRLAFGLTLDPTAAEDAVIRAAAKAYRVHGQLGPGASLWRWFASIVRREVKPADPPAGGTLPLTAHEPELRRLRRLTFDDRSVLLMHYYVDLSMEELAAAERLSKVEIRARLALARERVRPLLTEPDFVGQLDDSSLAHRLRALVGGLGDPGPDFPSRVETAIASGLQRGSYQRPVLAVLSAILLLALIPFVPGGLRALRALPLRAVAAQPRVVVTPSTPPVRPSGETSPVAQVTPSQEPAHTDTPTSTNTPTPHTPTPTQRTPTPSGPPPAVALTDPPLHPGEVGVAYGAVTWTASAGTPPYSWAVSPNGPFGLSVTPSGATLTLAGTATASGSASLSVTVTDSRNQSQTRTQGLSISPALTLSGPSVGEGKVDFGYPGSTFTAANGLGAYHWLATGGPSGIQANGNGATLTISGTPTQSGNFNMNISVTDDGGGGSSAGLMLHIYTHLVVSPNLPNGVKGSPYTGSIDVSGGRTPYQISVITLPPWLNAQVNGSSISLTSPAAGEPGDYQITVSVSDTCGGCTETQTPTFNIHVDPPPPA